MQAPTHGDVPALWGVPIVYEAPRVAREPERDPEVLRLRRRARRLLERQIVARDLPEFHDGTPVAELLTAVPPIPAGELLSDADTVLLLRQMHYLRQRADRLRQKIDPERPSPLLVEWCESLLKRADEVRDRVVSGWLSLAQRIAAMYARRMPFLDTFAIESGAMQGLLLGVERFNRNGRGSFGAYVSYSIRGYATNAIRAEIIHRRKFCPRAPETLRAVTLPPQATESELTKREETKARRLRRVTCALTALTAKQRDVIDSVHGLGGREPMTTSRLARQRGAKAATIWGHHASGLNTLRVLVGCPSLRTQVSIKPLREPQRAARAILKRLPLADRPGFAWSLLESATAGGDRTGGAA